MFEGRIVEIANVTDLFDHPLHPYTVRLLRATPGVELAEVGAASDESLQDLALDDPLLELREVAPGHMVLCRAAVHESVQR
jgi:ABC-type dipeptide/oligopeptide/nickel transport system ATPase component